MCNPILCQRLRNRSPLSFPLSFAPGHNRHFSPLSPSPLPENGVVSIGSPSDPARQFAGLTTPKMGEREGRRRGRENGRPFLLQRWPSNQSPSFSAKQHPLPTTADGDDDGDRKSCSLFLLLLLRRRRRKYWIRKQNQSRAHRIHPSPLSSSFTHSSLKCLLVVWLGGEIHATSSYSP